MEPDATYEKKQKRFIQDNNISCQHLVFSERCHSVAEAARAAGVNPRSLVKNVCPIDPQGHHD